jgi:hypothetical protein
MLRSLVLRVRSTFIAKSHLIFDNVLDCYGFDYALIFFSPFARFFFLHFDNACSLRLLLVELTG